MKPTLPVALTIAGSDSGGGAGIQADLKTFQALGVFGTSAITAITAQNTVAVQKIQPVDPELVFAQITAVLSDFEPQAIKTGMLYSASIIEAVASALARANTAFSLVVDPVMASGNGDELFQSTALGALLLFCKRATLITPNLPEASRILSRPIETAGQMPEAARQLQALTGTAILLKGGHLKNSPEAFDIFFDGTKFHEFRSPFMAGPNRHGTGCTLSAAIAAGLARGLPLLIACQAARSYLQGALQAAGAPGKGASRPVNHMWQLDDPLRKHADLNPSSQPRLK